jgi:frataxin
MLSRTTSRGLQRLLRTSSCSLRAVQPSSVTAARSTIVTSASTSTRLSTVQVSRFHSTPSRCKGLRPESSEPAPPEPEDSKVDGASRHVLEASPLSDGEYRDFSEKYFNELLGELESKQENGSDMEAEYSVCFNLFILCRTCFGKGKLANSTLFIISLAGRRPQRDCTRNRNLRA